MKSRSFHLVSEGLLQISPPVLVLQHHPHFSCDGLTCCSLNLPNTFTLLCLCKFSPLCWQLPFPVLSPVQILPVHLMVSEAVYYWLSAWSLAHSLYLVVIISIDFKTWLLGSLLWPPPWIECPRLACLCNLYQGVFWLARFFYKGLSRLCKPYHNCSVLLLWQENSDSSKWMGVVVF